MIDNTEHFFSEGEDQVIQVLKEAILELNTNKDLSNLPQKKEILDRVSTDIDNELLDKLLIHINSKVEFNRNFKTDMASIRTLLVGEFNEYLVRSEFSDTPERQVSPEIQDLETLLLEIWNDTARFGLDKVVPDVRNPDIAYIEIVEDTIVIKTVGEAKMGKLNKRSSEQMKYFYADLYRLIFNLKKIHQNQDLGRYHPDLEYLADYLDHLSIADPLKIKVIVPSNRPEITRDLQASTVRARLQDLIKFDRDNPDQYREIEDIVLSLLRGEDPKVDLEIVNGSFSINEIYAMFDAIFYDEGFQEEIKNIAEAALRN